MSSCWVDIVLFYSVQSAHHGWKLARLIVPSSVLVLEQSPRSINQHPAYSTWPGPCLLLSADFSTLLAFSGDFEVLKILIDLIFIKFLVISAFHLHLAC